MEYSGPHAHPQHKNFLAFAAPNAAVHNRLVHKKHDGAVGHHTNEMRAEPAVQTTKALFAYDGLCAVDDASVVPGCQRSVMN